MPPSIPAKLLSFLQCPRCFASLQSLICDHCKTEYFTFDDIPCLLPAGLQQKQAWQHQAATIQHQTEQSLSTMRNLLGRYDLLPQTRQRIEKSYHAAEASNATIQNLLSDADIAAVAHESLQHAALGSLSEYYHHILQDWAWDDAINQKKLQHALSVCRFESAQSVLVLGAGAGRLSWDLHNALDSDITIAADINPLLLLSGNKLIRKQQSFEFCELNSFPQIGKPISQYYDLHAVTDHNNKRHTWFPLAADVWRMPIKPQSLDLIVTGWFIDVHGGDNRDLIGLISQWLKPGGYWLNSGPLLYPRNMVFEQKYDHAELTAMLSMAGFCMDSEALKEEVHLNSPINVRTQTEQVWSFCAKRLPDDALAESPTNIPNPDEITPPWLILHHLPVPKLPWRVQDSHPLINLVLAQVDGNNSIHQITANVASQMPPGINAQEAIAALLGEMLEALHSR